MIPNKKIFNRFAIVLMVLLLPHGQAVHADSQAPRQIQITAKRFEYSPNKITLKKGEPVVLVLRSEDVAHSIVAKSLNLKADIPKGRETEVHFTPKEPGTFIGKCGRFCGSGHGKMQLVIEVTN